MEVARNNRAASDAYVTRLRNAGATPQQQAAATSILREASIDPAALEEARQLARAGRLDEAAARYQALFGQGEPPAAYAREYYQVLASASSTRALGQQGLAQLAARPDADDRTLLANAEALTYSPQTRVDGIVRLAALASRPTVGAQARTAWKQALGFYGQDPAVLPLLETYLQRFPGDADALRQQQAVRSVAPTPPTAADLASQGAFAALNSGSLAASETQFTQMLTADRRMRSRWAAWASCACGRTAPPMPGICCSAPSPPPRIARRSGSARWMPRTTRWNWPMPGRCCAAAMSRARTPCCARP